MGIIVNTNEKSHTSYEMAGSMNTNTVISHPSNENDTSNTDANTKKETVIVFRDIPVIEEAREEEGMQQCLKKLKALENAQKEIFSLMVKDSFMHFRRKKPDMYRQIFLIENENENQT